MGWARDVQIVGKYRGILYVYVYIYIYKGLSVEWSKDKLITTGKTMVFFVLNKSNDDNNNNYNNTC